MISTITTTIDALKITILLTLSSLKKTRTRREFKLSRTRI